MPRTNPTRAELSAALRYDPKTGIFRWRVDRGQRARAGGIAGCLDGNGYWMIGIAGKKYHAHRIAWVLMHGHWPTDHVDHINTIRSDNRLINLREATHGENMRNSGVHKDNTSGFKGVSFRQDTGRWQAYICTNSKQKHLGFFDTPEEAYGAYCAAAKNYHGRFANLGNGRNRNNDVSLNH